MLSGDASSTAIVALQEHLVGPQSVGAVAAMSGAKRVKALLPPTDPNTAREAAGVGLLACTHVRPRECKLCTQEAERMKQVGRLSIYMCDMAGSTPLQV
eukprot:11712632-Alexandrium_andersonii.AAC.1